MGHWKGQHFPLVLLDVRRNDIVYLKFSFHYFKRKNTGTVKSRFTVVSMQKQSLFLYYYLLVIVLFAI